MAESVLADHDGTQAKKVMKVKAKRKSGSASITPSSRDPESSPERAPVVDAPPPLDPTHSYMEDCVAIMKHAIDTAAGRMAFPAARREKVVIELVNIGMHFGLEGLDGVTWHGVTYNQWSVMRNRIWEATLSFLNLATDLGRVSTLKRVDSDAVPDANADRVDSTSAFLTEALKYLDVDLHAKFKKFAADTIIADVKQHECFTRMKQMVLERFNGATAICPKIMVAAIEAAIGSLEAREFWQAAHTSCSASPSADGETFVAMRGKYALSLMSEVTNAGFSLMEPHAGALPMLATLEAITVHKLCEFDVGLMEIQGNSADSSLTVWASAWTALVSKLGTLSTQPDCIESSIAHARSSLAVKKESHSPSPGLPAGTQIVDTEETADDLHFEWNLKQLLEWEQPATWCPSPEPLSNQPDFTKIKRFCNLVENDMYEHAFSNIPATVKIKMGLPNKDAIQKKKVPNMTFSANGPAKLYFCGPVVTKPTAKSIHVGDFLGCQLFITEPDFDSDSWCPAWAVPVAGKKEVATMLFKSEEAALELAPELSSGEKQSEIKIKMPYLEVNAHGALLRPKLPATDVSGYGSQTYGPRTAFLHELTQANPLEKAGQPNEKKRKDKTEPPRHLKHLLT